MIFLQAPASIPEMTPLYETMEEIVSGQTILADEGGQNIPDWLKGSLLRNGPGLMNFGHERVKSLADGLPMIRKYQVERGQMMNMTRRLLQSQTLHDNLSADKYSTTALN